jgi:phosphoribosylaminoimidazole-succinocarboxamide synthase
MTPETLEPIPTDGVMEVELPGIAPLRRGKVRTVFEAGPEHLVIVATDRLSAYDSILPTPIPGKGEILTRMSGFWMRMLRSAAPHHLVSEDPREFPEPFRVHVATRGPEPARASRGAHRHRVRRARLPHRLGLEGVPRERSRVRDRAAAGAG